MYNNKNIIGCLNRNKPAASAVMRGSEQYSSIFGIVAFYPVVNGILVTHEFSGLPRNSGVCSSPILALHIHDGSCCCDFEGETFGGAGSHYNPNDCPHPFHAGDLPPVFSNSGYAWGAMVTNRFSIRDIIGKPVILHDGVDDFTSQPSGNAGNRIACGIISVHS